MIRQATVRDLPVDLPVDLPADRPVELPRDLPVVPPRPDGPADLPDERRRFAALQRGLAPMVRRVFSDRMAEQTVVVVPSLSLDAG